MIDCLATTDALSAVFTDRSLVESMLAFEVALARVESRLRIIPASAAEAIDRAANVDDFDVEAIVSEARRSGTVGVPLVEQLTGRVRAVDMSSAAFVHWGATSQDVADTAIVLTIKRAHVLLGADQRRLALSLRNLSDRHAGTLMLARTLLQAAPPITFGLKVAGWFGAVSRSWTRLGAALDDALVLQLGGSTGTLAALDSAGPDVARELASELGLANPTAPWHAHRDRLGSLVAAHGVYIASLGKIARDVSLLMQSEVAEAAGPGGRSSAMPHKRNPAGCAIALAAAIRAPGLVAAFLAGMVQEHERGVGGWQAEWPTIAAIVQASAAAAAAMADTVEGLAVSPDAMRRHIEETNGAVFAERVAVRLAPALGRDEAHRRVSEAVDRSRATGRSLVDVLADTPDIVNTVGRDELKGFDRPEAYLGAAEAFRVRLLGESGSEGLE